MKRGFISRLGLFCIGVLFQGAEGWAASAGDVLAGPGAALDVTRKPTVYTASTDNLTKVANAFRLQTYSLTTQVIFAPGLVLTKPVCIRGFYDSYNGRAYSDVQNQAYDAANGARLVFNDPEGIGTPRQANLKISLFEPGSGPCGPRVVGTSYDIPNVFRVNLDPLYAVTVSRLQVARLNACTLLEGLDMRARWFTPDNQPHETRFRLETQPSVFVAGTEWQGLTVSASNNFHIPVVGIFGFYVPNGPSNVNIIPAPLVAGSPMASQEIKQGTQSDTFKCTLSLRYLINRQLRRSSPQSVAPVGSLTGGATRAQ